MEGVEEDGIGVPEQVDPTDGRGSESFAERVRALSSAEWPRVVGVAVATTVPVTLVAGLVSLDRTDSFVVGDLASLAFGTLMLVVLTAGIDVRLSRTSRTFARWIAVLTAGYTIAALVTVVAALP